MKYRHLTIEITTRCNLACVMCPHGLPSGVVNKRDASDALVDMVLSNLDDYEVVQPTGVGEPLLSAGFWRIVDHLAKTKAARLAFFTNGILLNNANVNRVLAAPIEFINVSVDAASEVTHHQLRGISLERTTAGIRRLVAAIADLPLDQREHSTVKMSMVLMRQNIAEAADFVRLAKSVGVNTVYFEHLVDPFMDASKWNVRRDAFQFNYADQRLFSSPELADKHIIEAIDVADSLGVAMEGPELVLCRDHLHHEHRPCRAKSRAQHRLEENE